MRAIGLVSVGLVMIPLLVTDAAAAASNRWCAVYSRRGVENCTYATQQQCLAVVLGSDAWCRPNPFPGTAYGTGGSWSSGSTASEPVIRNHAAASVLQGRTREDGRQ